ncbi:unnamed protein product [Didymodactylos carnosus]|uniref:Uncharacterized protein n=1 Tax=Didymodactylos carnosus TaxID=1234261 RepID=A0A8S2DV71_9BILA|nr:unnamed protein product [Didymodactylos carnosus]CAF3828211.1 unnamed protein product [Didymodactylos carnosus]
MNTVAAPDSVRYIRAHELMPSERSTVTKSSKASTPSSTKALRPMTNASQAKSTAPVWSTAPRLLNRARVLDAPVVIRRPPRRLIINVVRETVMPLTVYG